jgi:Rad3-related DNA helicase
MVSNYAFWMRDYRERLAEDVDTLVCDEAHALPQIMTGSLAVSITPKAQFYRHPCPTGTSPDDWARWAMNVAQEIELETGMLRAALNQDDTTGETTTVEGLPKQLTRLLRAADKMAQLSNVNSAEWVVSQEADRVIFTPVWVKDFVEGLLFKGVKTVVLSSATLCRKTLELLGVDEEKTEFTEFRHTFPVEMRRLYYVPTVRINKGTSDVSMRRVVNTIDAFVSKRLDRKGIIHTVSYKRRDFVLKHSDYASIMLTNETRTIADAVLAFKQAPAPCILVSPSVSTGFDFIYDECSYQILLKVPYPNMGDPVVKKRMEQDAEYAAYIAAQELVQACGRGTRAADDFCESVILDDVFDRFIKWHKTLFPRWFLEAVVRTGLVPEPPDRR